MEKLGFKKNQKLMQLTTRMCDSKDKKQRTCLKSSANSERSESMPDEIPAAGKFDMTDYSFFITVKIFWTILTFGVKMKDLESIHLIKLCLQKH